MDGRIILAVLAALLAAPTAAPEDPAAIARDVLKTTPLIDGHNDLFVGYMDCRDCPRDLAAYDIGTRTSGDTDIPRLQQGMVGGTLLNVFGPDTSLKTTLEAYGLLDRLAVTYADRIAIAGSAAEVRSIFKSGRIALIPSLENAKRLENDPAVLRMLHRLGLRAVTLAYKTNDLADAADDAPKHDGLSPLGVTMVRAMNDAGVLVDLSHTAPATMHDVLDISSAPVIFSHSSARALTDVERNVPDDVLRRLPINGGLVMVAFVPHFTTPESARWEAAVAAESEAIGKAVEAKTLSEADADTRWAAFEAAHPPPQVTIAQVADHIDHIRRIAGPNHVGIGSDFDGITAKVTGLEDVSTFPALFTELARRGWSKADLAKLAGENFLRVMAAAEAVAAK
jgi:membrane dipeptidase